MVMVVKRLLFASLLFVVAGSVSFGQKLLIKSLQMIPVQGHPGAVRLMPDGGSTESKNGVAIDFELIKEEQPNKELRILGVKYQKCALDTLIVGDAVIVFIQDLAFTCTGVIGMNRTCKDQSGAEVIPGDAQDKLAGAWKKLTITAIQREPDRAELWFAEKVILSNQREIQSLPLVEKDGWYIPDLPVNTPPPQE
jgi:hypothetical protein